MADGEEADEGGVVIGADFRVVGLVAVAAGVEILRARRALLP